MLRFEVVGDEIVDAQLERLGGRVTEDLRRRVPENDLSGVHLRDDDRVPDALEEPADTNVPRSHDQRRITLVLVGANYVGAFRASAVALPTIDAVRQLTRGVWCSQSPLTASL